MPYRRGHFLWVRPVSKHFPLLVHTTAYYIWYHRPVRVPEAWLQPVYKTLFVESSPACECGERAIIPHDRLPIPKTPIRVLRVCERHAEMLTCHLFQLALRSQRSSVVVNHIRLRD